MTYVCEKCVEEEELQKFVSENSLNSENDPDLECDYCGNYSENIVDLSDLSDFIMGKLGQEWCDPAETMPYDGGYLFDPITTDDVLQEIDFWLENDQLMEDIIRSIDYECDGWCESDWAVLSPSSRWKHAWDRFKKVIKHQRRFTYWFCDDETEDSYHPDYLPPSRMLKEIGDLLMMENLFVEMPLHSEVWRARSFTGDFKQLKSMDMTPPPDFLAIQPNRMSPAGVPMFYGATDKETALAEVIQYKPGEWLAACKFRVSQPLTILDFTALPKIPSYFSDGGAQRRHVIHFLKNFTDDLIKPIERDGQAHIDYVPTQVFTESLRYTFKGPGGTAIHGIKYPSRKSNTGVCIAIFADQKSCLPPTGFSPPPQLLECVENSILSIGPPR